MAVQPENCVCTPAPCGIQKVLETFVKNFPDEIEDSNRYLDLAIGVNEMHESELHEGLMAMAYDEYTHAKFIHETLMAYGVCITEGEHKAWHALEERIMTLFPR